MNIQVRKEDLVHLFLQMLRKCGMLQHYVEEFHIQNTYNQPLSNFLRNTKPEWWVSGAFMWPQNHNTLMEYNDINRAWIKLIKLANKGLIGVLFKLYGR